VFPITPLGRGAAWTLNVLRNAHTKKTRKAGLELKALFVLPFLSARILEAIPFCIKVKISSTDY
jgi:hypothetical protein